MGDSDAYTCLLNTDVAKDGTRIDGHSYKDIVAFHDLDSDKYYSVLQCTCCGYPTVGWSENPNMIRGHTYNKEVGGTE